MALSANDVLALARAGFNSSQIALLSGAMTDAPAQQQAQQPAQPVQQAQQPAQQPTQQPAQQPVQPARQQEPSPADFMAELQKLTGAIQMNNQINSQQPKTETVEDILATIIEP